MCPSLCLGAGVEPCTTPTDTVSCETSDHERVVFHRLWLFQQLVQLGMILVGGALEPRPDLDVSGLVVVPPGAFELEHGLVPFGDHRASLAVGRP